MIEVYIMSIGARWIGVDLKLLVIATYKTKMIPMNKVYFVKFLVSILVYNQVQ